MLEKSPRISTFDCIFIEFVFNSSCQNNLGFSKCSVYWTSKGKENKAFDKNSLTEAISAFNHCYRQQ